MKLVKFGLPDTSVWTFPQATTPMPPSPFENELLTSLFNFSMKFSTPMTIALVYFSSVHIINPIIIKRQKAKYLLKNEKIDKDSRVPPAPYAISQTPLFRLFVLLHNVFLCVYSIWTFVGMTSSIGRTMSLFKRDILPELFDNSQPFKKLEVFFQSVCDSKNGLFSRQEYHNLEIFGYWFYISKFYEVLDTIIILLKGRPSSLLQSYHHSGAMMCMWAGVRFQSPPIWIFVVFNSFIHSLMYFYFSLSCLHIKVPNAFKRALTSLQITQFIIGGSIAILHAFVFYIDTAVDPEVVGKENMKLISCISSPDQAIPVLLNVAYLAPLTALFGAFYIESYLKRK
jgi:hypothetical protein